MPLSFLFNSQVGGILFHLPQISPLSRYGLDGLRVCWPPERSLEVYPAQRPRVGQRPLESSRATYLGRGRGYPRLCGRHADAAFPPHSPAPSRASRASARQTAQGGASERASERAGCREPAALAPAAAPSPAICRRGPWALGHGKALPACPLRPAPRPGRCAAEGATGPRGRQSRAQPLGPQPHSAAAAAKAA
jgi:hypothetical protein